MGKRSLGGGVGVLKKNSSKTTGTVASRTKFDSWANNDSSSSTKGRQSSMQRFFTVTTVKKSRLGSSSPAAAVQPCDATQQTQPQATSSAREPALSSAIDPVSLMSSDIIQCCKRNATFAAPPTETASKSFQQMYLDLGQRDFAKRTLCGVCGMMYVHGLHEDIKQHDRVCKDFVLGVPFKASQARIVVQDDDKETSIVEIRPSDAYTLRKKVAQVRAIVDNELGFVPSESSDTASPPRSAYLFIRKRRVVGMVTVEAIEWGYILHNNYERSKLASKAMLGIHQMWVHSKFRKQGIATRLIDVARERMVFSMVIPPELVAFSSPTEAGVKFATRYVSHVAADEKEVLVYDCS